MRRILLLLVVLGLCAPPAARAQFYDLDGTYRCVTTPNSVCSQALGDQPPLPPPPAKEKDEAAAQAFAEVIARVRKRAPTPDDMRVLESHVEAKDSRAIEVLAWCKLNGIGTASDALGAYYLYRDAAALGVANARKNQIAIYESRLTSAERQQVLLKENAR